VNCLHSYPCHFHIFYNVILTTAQQMFNTKFITSQMASVKVQQWRGRYLMKHISNRYYTKHQDPTVYSGIHHDIIIGDKELRSAKLWWPPVVWCSYWVPQRPVLTVRTDGHVKLRKMNRSLLGTEIKLLIKVTVLCESLSPRNGEQRDALQIWRAAKDVMNTQSRTADNGWSSRV
jgi:hypothetical protein